MADNNLQNNPQSPSASAFTAADEAARLMAERRKLSNAGNANNKAFFEK